jgi:heptosyltransferase-2
MKVERRVLVVSPNWLGDAVMALPAVADVRRHAPDAELVVAARASVAPLFTMAPYVDRVITLKWRGRLLQRRALADDATMLRNARIDSAIILPNSVAAAWLVKKAGIPDRCGYAREFRRPLLSRAIQLPRGGMHQGAYYQNLTRELGIPSGPLEPLLDVPAAALDAAGRLLIERGWDRARPLLVMAAGAAYGTAKRWPPRHFGHLAMKAVRERDVACVLVGSAGDREAARWVRESAGRDVAPLMIDLTGATSLEQLAGVMRMAAACVSNDSGAMHLAAAVGAPLVALFGPTREHETAPLSRRGSHSEVLINPVWCRPCMLRECPIDHRCMKGLLPERVFGSVDRLMNTAQG